MGQSPILALALPSPNGVAELEEHVRNRLKSRLRDFQIFFEDGGLILRGRTRTFHAKQLAQHAVMELCDLPIHGNEIDVC
jgi:hypothetical protein